MPLANFDVLVQLKLAGGLEDHGLVSRERYEADARHRACLIHTGWDTLSRAADHVIDVRRLFLDPSTRPGAKHSVKSVPTSNDGCYSKRPPSLGPRHRPEQPAPPAHVCHA
jgi:hypothetical protein